MNKQNILAVADAIENHTIPDLGFNMGDFRSDLYPDQSGHNCKTTACIAGWASALSGFDPNTERGSHATAACQFLGLRAGSSEADELFYAWGDFSPFIEIRPARAAAVLRNFAETGKVDWSIA